MSSINKSLIICTTPRSGSTYFANVLKETGLFGMPEEWLHSYCVEQVCTEMKLSASPNSTVELISHLQTFAMRGHESGIFALKTMWDVFSLFLDQARKERQSKAKNIFSWNIVSDFFPNPRFIYLERKNKLGQAISYLKATQTGLWHSVNLEENGGTIPGYTPIFDPFKIRYTLRNFHEQELSWKKLFWLERIRPLEVIYEDFMQDQMGYLRRVADYVGDIPIPSVLPQTSLKPIRDKLNKQWTTLYRELESQAIFNLLNDHVPEHCPHWLFGGSELKIEVPIQPDSPSPRQRFHINAGVRNSSNSHVQLQIPEYYCNESPALILQATWCRKDDEFIQRVYNSTPLPLNWRPDELRVVRIEIEAPEDPEMWTLQLQPTLTAGGCYLLLGMKPVGINTTQRYRSITGSVSAA